MEKHETVLPGSRKKTNEFISGVFVLSLSAIIVKIIGLIYKIPMLKLLGSEGMGYFNSAYELYSLFCIIATAGLPVAMSVMISSCTSKGTSGADLIFKVSMRLFLLLGTVGTLLLLIFAEPFASFLGSERGLYCIAAIAPTVFFICISSAYRGYFQGLGKMTPTALSQIIEAVGKLVLGLAFAYAALNIGAAGEKVAAFAVMGLTAGTAISTVYLALSKKMHKREAALLSDEAISPQGILSPLLKTAIPVTLSSAVISLTKVIDMTMILRRMQSTGYSSEAAFAAYGNYTTLALPLFGLAPTLVTSVAMPLIPTLSRAIATDNKSAQVTSVTEAVKLTSIIAMPVSVGLTLFAKPILSLLFAGEYEAVAEASPLLTILGLSVALSCLITVGNAILQAYLKASIPIMSMIIGSALKIVLAFILIGIPKIGIAGAPISTFFCDLSINAVNIYFIIKSMPSRPKLGRTLVLPFISAITAVSLARVFYNFSAGRWGDSGMLTLVCIAIAAVLYLLMSIATGVIGKKEILQVTGRSKVSPAEQDVSSI